MSDIALRFPQSTSPHRAQALAALLARSLGRVALLPLLLGAPILSAAQALPTQAAARAPIRLEQVVSALSMTMLPLENAVVRLLAQTTATIADPGLEIKGVEAWGERGARVRVSCAAHAQCLPFYVAVDWPDDAAAKAALHSAGLLAAGSTHGLLLVRRQVASPLPGTTPSTKETAGAEGSLVTSNLEDGRAAEETSVQAGSHATLLIDGQRLHIKLPVICLERGSVGRTIRVAALDHKQTYRAEVIDSTLLRGSL